MIARARVVALLAGEASVAGIAWWLNDTRREEGPVLLPLTHGHGVHRMDLLLVTLGLLVAIIALKCPGWGGWASFWAEPDTNEHPTNGIPQTRRPGHDQLVSQNHRTPH